MLLNRISGLPVLNNRGKLVGIITKEICYAARKLARSTVGRAGSIFSLGPDAW
jgi:CBS domain-containing protein